MNLIEEKINNCIKDAGLNLVINYIDVEEEVIKDASGLRRVYTCPAKSYREINNIKIKEFNRLCKQRLKSVEVEMQEVKPRQNETTCLIIFKER